MKITAFDPDYATKLTTGDVIIGGSSGSNNFATGGDVEGSSGDYSVVGLRQRVSLSSNMGDNTIGSVLTTIQSSPWLATFALPSNSGSVGSNFETKNNGGASTIFAHGAMGATETFDPWNGNVHTGTLTADLTVTLNAPTGSGAALLELWLTQDGTGGWDITWPGSVTVNGTPDTTLGTTTVWLLDTVDGGTSWVAFIAGGGTVVAALDDLTDVVITAAAEGHMLRHNGTAWVNTPGRWEPLMDGGSPYAPLDDGTGTDWLFVWVNT